MLPLGGDGFNPTGGSGRGPDDPCPIGKRLAGAAVADLPCVLDSLSPVQDDANLVMQIIGGA